MENREKQLMFATSFVLGCLRYDKSKRPSFNEIEHVLQGYSKIISA